MLKDIQWTFLDVEQPIEVCSYCEERWQERKCEDCEDLFWCVDSVCGVPVVCVCVCAVMRC